MSAPDDIYACHVLQGDDYGPDCFYKINSATIVAKGIIRSFNLEYVDNNAVKKFRYK